MLLLKSQKRLWKYYQNEKTLLLISIAFSMYLKYEEPSCNFLSKSYKLDGFKSEEKANEDYNGSIKNEN